VRVPLNNLHSGSSPFRPTRTAPLPAGHCRPAGQGGDQFRKVPPDYPWPLSPGGGQAVRRNFRRNHAMAGIVLRVTLTPRFRVPFDKEEAHSAAFDLALAELSGTFALIFIGAGAGASRCRRGLSGWPSPTAWWFWLSA